MQKGLNFAPSSNANLFKLFKELHKYIGDITVKLYYSLKTDASTNVTLVNAIQREHIPTAEENDDSSMSNNIDEEAINILEEL